MVTKTVRRLSHVVLTAILCALQCYPAAAQFRPLRKKPTGPWMNRSLSPDERAGWLVAQLTLDEKISLLHGGGWQMMFGGPDAPPSKSPGNAGYIPGIPRLGIPVLQMAEADLPHSTLTKQPAPSGGADMAPIFPGASFKQNARKFDIAYDEGLKVGYKWYDAERKEILFPFGFGLSYTTYKYAGLKLFKDGVTFDVTNTGARAGAEIAEVYATLPQKAGEPFKRLVAWEKVRLGPGESKTVTLRLDPFCLSIFNADKDAWELAPGEYVVQAGGSSRALPLRGSIHLD
jgi:hypothetical protein